MGDYIEKQEAIDAAKHAWAKGLEPTQYIEQILAANVRPVVRGRWKYFCKQNKAVCTVCSFERDLDQNFGKAIACPNCGADMREAKE